MTMSTYVYLYMYMVIIAKPKMKGALYSAILPSILAASMSTMLAMLWPFLFYIILDMTLDTGMRLRLRMNTRHVPTSYPYRLCVVWVHLGLCVHQRPVAPALCSMAFSVLKGSSKNLKGGGGAAPQHVALGKTHILLY